MVRCCVVTDVFGRLPFGSYAFGWFLEWGRSVAVGVVADVLSWQSLPFVPPRHSTAFTQKQAVFVSLLRLLMCAIQPVALSASYRRAVETCCAVVLRHCAAGGSGQSSRTPCSSSPASSSPCAPSPVPLPAPSPAPSAPSPPSRVPSCQGKCNVARGGAGDSVYTI